MKKHKESILNRSTNKKKKFVGQILEEKGVFLVNHKAKEKPGHTHAHTNIKNDRRCRKLLQREKVGLFYLLHYYF